MLYEFNLTIKFKKKKIILSDVYRENCLHVCFEIFIYLFLLLKYMFKEIIMWWWWWWCVTVKCINGFLFIVFWWKRIFALFYRTFWWCWERAFLIYCSYNNLIDKARIQSINIKRQDKILYIKEILILNVHFIFSNIITVIHFILSPS